MEFVSLFPLDFFIFLIVFSLEILMVQAVCLPILLQGKFIFIFLSKLILISLLGQDLVLIWDAYLLGRMMSI